MGGDQDGRTLSPGRSAPGMCNPGVACDERSELARSTGRYFHHQRLRAPNPTANDLSIQEELLAECGQISGIAFVDQPAALARSWY